MSIGALAIAIVLVVLNGFFVAVEFAYTASRRPPLEERATSGNRFARWALASMNELPVTFAAAQLGVAAMSLGLGFVIEESLEASFHGLFEAMGLPSGVVAALALIISLLIVSFVHNVFGEMAPKNATIAAPERAALLLAAPFRAYVTVFRPIIVGLSWVAAGLLRLFRVKTRHTVETMHSAEDIASLVKTIGAGEVIDPSSSRLLSSALAFQSKVVNEVMVPRPDLVAMPVGETPAGLERTVVATGHSRIPVYGENLDDIRGFVHAKDLIGVADEDLDRPLDQGLVRTVPMVPETTPISPVMEMMRSEGVHMALAIDEHGGVAGLVTLEDIAEELVGDIRDEHDIREVMEVRPAGRDRYLVAGQTRIDRLDEVGAGVADGEYETVGGYIMAELGRVPRRGDLVEGPNFAMTVRRMDGRRVREIELTVSPPEPDQLTDD
ncbi:MAG TPA: hemolysin family protein [Acidimicrobiia bacterium]|nr:hemolysin family protein [Acidimicrobiia bacterium]